MTISSNPMTAERPRPNSAGSIIRGNHDTWYAQGQTELEILSYGFTFFDDQRRHLSTTTMINDALAGHDLDEMIVTFTRDHSRGLLRALGANIRYCDRQSREATVSQAIRMTMHSCFANPIC